MILTALLARSVEQCVRQKVVDSDIYVKIIDGGLCFYFLEFYFLFFVFFLFSFSIFRTTQVRVCQSRCHISHKLMA